MSAAKPATPSTSFAWTPTIPIAFSSPGPTCSSRTTAAKPGRASGGGRTGYPFITTFGDFRSFWIDPEDSDHMIATSDGGVSVSYDGGRTSDHFANLKLGEFYAIGVDMDQPYHIYGGLQDHESWMGPSNGWSGRINIDDWVSTRHRRRHV